MILSGKAALADRQKLRLHGQVSARYVLAMTRENTEPVSDRQEPANSLVVIGRTGSMRAYLNLPRAEAVRRFRASEGWDPETNEAVTEFRFADEFWAYDAGPTAEGAA